MRPATSSPLQMKGVADAARAQLALHLSRALEDERVMAVIGEAVAFRCRLKDEHRQAQVPVGFECDVEQRILVRASGGAISTARRPSRLRRPDAAKRAPSSR